MAIRTVITRGYGNGTFNGTIGLLVLRGYQSSAVTGAPIATPSWRIVQIEAEARVLAIESEDRVLAIGSEDRIQDIDQ